MLETLIVIAIVALAGLWLGRRIWRRAAGRGQSPCGNCPGCKPAGSSRPAGDSPPACGDGNCRPQNDPPAPRQG